MKFLWTCVLSFVKIMFVHGYLKFVLIWRKWSSSWVDLAAAEYLFSPGNSAIKHSLFECSEISIRPIPAFILEKLWAAGVCPGRQRGTYRQRENHMLLMVKFKGNLEKLHVRGYRVHWQNTANREPRIVLLWGNDCAVHCKALHHL